LLIYSEGELIQNVGAVGQRQPLKLTTVFAIRELH
jgi:hypothetical protein